VALLQAGIALKMFEEIGFQPAKSSSLSKKLRNITPSGSTAMLDSVASGIALILQLNEALESIGMNETWNFVHIVLTDGDDNASELKIEEACTLMATVGMTIKTSVIKTYFIGVDVTSSQKAIEDMVALTATGGENAEFFEVSNVNIGEIFERIKVGLGVRQQTTVRVASQDDAILGAETNYTPVLTLQKQHYAVLFNLDISGSMGQSDKWNKVCRSVEDLMRNLDDGDLVGGIVFNGKIDTLTAPQQNKPIPTPPQLNKPIPTPPPTVNNYNKSNLYQTASSAYNGNTSRKESFRKNEPIKEEKPCLSSCNIF